MVSVACLGACALIGACLQGPATAADDTRGRADAPEVPPREHAAASGALDAMAASSFTVVSGGIERDAIWTRKPDAVRSADGAIVVEGARTVLWAPVDPGRGDFTAKLELMVPELSASGAGIRLDASVFGIDGPGEQLYTAGPLFSGGAMAIPDSAGKVRAGVPCEVTVTREGEWLECLVNGERAMRAQVGAAAIGRIGVWAGRGSIAVGSFRVEGAAGRAVPAEIVWSSGGDVWDEISLPAIAALADGAVLVSGSAVRSDEQGKDVRRVVVRVRDAAGKWSESRAVGPEDLAGNDTTLLVDGDTVHLLAQAGPRLTCMRSADGGASWSAATEVVLPSPRSRMAGHGVRVPVDAGAVICVPIVMPIEGGGRSVALLRSTDGGATWTPGAAVVEPADAPAIVSLGGARVAMIGVRPQMEGRWIWTSEDAGVTWGAPIACAGLDPGTMRASVWRKADGSLWIAESARRAPNALRRWRSDDAGATWIEQLPIQLTPAGACAVALAPDGTVWMAHEGGDFARREHVLVRKVP